MEKYIKENKNVLIIVVIILGLAFYWFQLRPTNIKKSCSWTTEQIEADAGITKEQAEQNIDSFKNKCDITKTYSTGYQGLGKVQSVECFLLQSNSTERPPKPEREEVSEATKNEYDMCLREHGL